MAIVICFLLWWVQDVVWVYTGEGVSKVRRGHLAEKEEWELGSGDLEGCEDL